MKARWRCQHCSRIFTAWAPAQRHADSHGGARLETILANHPDHPPGRDPSADGAPATNSCHTRPVPSEETDR